MGIIKAFKSALAGVSKDMWKEFFMCDSMPADILLVKGVRRTNNNHGNSNVINNHGNSNVINNHGDANVITDGSVFTVADGQAAIVVDQGEVVYECAEPGEHVYQGVHSANVFEKGGIKKAVREVGRRVSFGGDIPYVERLYYVNTKLITGGSFLPVRLPFRFVDANLNADMDCTIECAGTYAFRIVTPGLFYKTITGNILNDYRASKIISVMNAEFSSLLQTSFAKRASEGVRTYQLPELIPQLQEELRECCSESWKERYGIAVETIGFTTFSVNGNDLNTINRLQSIASLKDPAMAGASLAAAQGDAVNAAAKR